MIIPWLYPFFSTVAATKDGVLASALTGRPVKECHDYRNGHHDINGEMRARHGREETQAADKAEPQYAIIDDAKIQANKNQ